jgi:hypothetical protein
VYEGERCIEIDNSAGANARRRWSWAQTQYWDILTVDDIQGMVDR